MSCKTGSKLAHFESKSFSFQIREFYNDNYKYSLLHSSCIPTCFFTVFKCLFKEDSLYVPFHSVFSLFANKIKQKDIQSFANIALISYICLVLHQIPNRIEPLK